MKKIVLASNNIHKVKEIKEILSDYEILTLNDISFYDDIVEDGDTFLDNALIKARTISKYIRKLGFDYDVIADDSGLCCNGLDGAPGVYSARYAGNHDDSANRKKIIHELKGKDKTANFVCCMVLYRPDDTYYSFEGTTSGVIISEERGKTDFGYDCIFLSDDLGITFGEASDEAKNNVSHRKRALEKVKTKLEKYN